MESQCVSINLENDMNSHSNKKTEISNLLEEQIVTHSSKGEFFFWSLF